MIGQALLAGWIGGAVLYAALVVWLLAGIRRSRHRAPAGAAEVAEAAASVSVVVAARDEAACIEACLDALRRQRYAGRLQVVAVDDRSRDDTWARMQACRRRWEGPAVLTLVQAPEAPRFSCPKKSALAAGIDAATGELLMFTDADCEPPPDWVRGLAAGFTPPVGLVAGYAYPAPLTRFAQRLLAVDNLGVAALAEGSIGMGTPLACTGRSLAYRRAVYDEVGGFAAIGHLVSGDDVYFLRLVASRTAWGIAYRADAAAAVPSAPAPRGWRALLSQKTRHASKASRYEGGARWLGVGVYAFHVALLAGCAQALWAGMPHPVFLAAWSIRWLLDAVLLARFAPRAGEVGLLAYLPVVEILYIPYVLLLVPLGRAGWFRWKTPDSDPPRSRG